MRSNQNKRMRGRNRKSQNPLSRVFESNGPDVKIRGSASHIAEKYIQLARDAQSSGDPVAAENYYQHAEHYFRLIAGVQEQYRQTQPFYRSDVDGRSDDSYDDSEVDVIGGEPAYPSREPREPQPYPVREPQPQLSYPQHEVPVSQVDASGDVDRLPPFITGGASQQQVQGNGQNGHEPTHQAADRFPLHRRRRRHRGPRGETSGSPLADNARPVNE